MNTFDPGTQLIIDAFDAHARKRCAELLPRTENAPLQATRETAFCLGYKAGVVDLNVVLKLTKVQHWSVTGRYAAPGPRPAKRRHPAPEDFRRRTIVGPAAPSTIEVVLDLLEVPEDVRAKIRANSIVQNFVEGRLTPDHPQPHHMVGMHYVSDAPDAQLVEWSIEFACVTQFVEPAIGGSP